MRTSSIRAGHLVLCDVRGQRYLAEVAEVETEGSSRTFLVRRPTGTHSQHPLPYRRISARQISRAWRPAAR